MRKIIQIDEERCDGCGRCVPACAEGAIEIVNGKARIVSEKYCDGLGACLGDCPNDALSVVEREVDDFDEEAVEQYLKEKAASPVEQPASGACPSSGIQSFLPSNPCETGSAPVIRSSPSSELSHWPVQVHLVPPTAPFLKGADLLVAADCTAVAYPGFHQEFLRDRAVMIGCPKFDDVDAYVQKFTDIFITADIKHVTAIIMEVPCCSGLPMMLKKAMDAAGKKIPMEEIVIGMRGEILERRRAA